MRGKSAETGDTFGYLGPERRADSGAAASEPVLRHSVRRVIETDWFQNAIVAVIVLNAVVIGLQTSETAMAYAGGLLHALDRIAVAIFVLEILAKLYVYRWRFFASGWNLFDFVIVGAALVPTGREVAVLRALRILRALRLISAVPKMRQVVQGLLSAIPAMGTVILLLSLIFYVSAVMATGLFGESFPELFGDIGLSLFSLFQVMTLEAWSDGIVRPVMKIYPYAWAFFVPFILVTSFTVLNLFIAIIVNAMQEAHDDDAAAERDVILHEVRALRQEVARLAEPRPPHADRERGGTPD
ncbi:MAG: ion transporter [Alphaproteobacteria bacterium]